MPGILVDSNILIDVMSIDSAWYDRSAATIERLADTSRLVINPIIFAEVSIGFDDIDELRAVLPPEQFAREDIPYEAAFLAGKAYLLYRRRGGTRQMVLPDFFVGAHALVAGYVLLTRDPARYRRYFPKVSLIAPD